MTKEKLKEPLKNNVLNRLKNLKIRDKILSFFILLNVISFSVIYLFIYNSYHETTLNKTEFLSNAMLKNIELNLGLLYGELSDLSLQIYSNQNLNDLMTAYYQSGASSVDETDFAQSNLNDEIQNMLGQYVDTHNYIQSIQLSINNTPFYAAKDSSHMISAAENFELKKWFPDIYDANGKIVVIPSYAQQYSSNYSSITNEFIISFAREVKNLREIYKNERIGVLDIDFQESYLKNLYGDANVSKNSFTMITTQDGAIISATEDSLIDKSVLKEGYLKNIPKSKSSIMFSSIKGKKYMISYNTYDKLGWKIFSFIPMTDLQLDRKTLEQTIFILIIQYIVVNLLLSYILKKVLSNPLQRLMHAIRRIDSGDFSTQIKIDNNDEMGDIGIYFNKMVNSIQTLVNENYVIKLKEKEAQIRTLQAQINPHFLYNTLDTISWKVMLIGGGDISKIVSSLGEILRYSISNNNQLSTLEQDINQVKNYLFIQKSRYTDRFEAYFHLDPSTLNLKVNKLLIQPMVENAIQHGLEEKEEHGILSVTSSLSDNILKITVFDNGKGIPEEQISEILSNKESPDKSHKNHVGIRNVHERLQLLYGRDYGIEIKSRVNKYTKIILKLPVIKEE